MLLPSRAQSVPKLVSSPRELSCSPHRPRQRLASFAFPLRTRMHQRGHDDVARLTRLLGVTETRGERRAARRRSHVCGPGPAVDSAAWTPPRALAGSLVLDPITLKVVAARCSGPLSVRARISIFDRSDRQCGTGLAARVDPDTECRWDLAMRRSPRGGHGSVRS